MCKLHIELYCQMACVLKGGLRYNCTHFNGCRMCLCEHFIFVTFFFLRLVDFIVIGFSMEDLCVCAVAIKFDFTHDNYM